MYNKFKICPTEHPKCTKTKLSRICELDLSNPKIAHIRRCGTVFYTVISGQIYFCLGRDKESGDLTDFGGARKRNENPIECAVRESNEESRYSFATLTVADVQDCFCLYNSAMLIIFIPIITDSDNIITVTSYNFNNRVFLPEQQKFYKCYNEVSELYWLSENDINMLLLGLTVDNLFYRVKKFILSYNKNSSRLVDFLRATFMSYLRTKVNPATYEIATPCC
jgi:hypothetical protein